MIGISIRKKKQRVRIEPVVEAPRAAARGFGVVGPARIAGGGAVSRLSTAGLPVNHITAQRQSTVFACRNYIKGQISQLPFFVYRRNAAGGADREPGALENILSRRASREWSASQFWGRLLDDAVMRGNGFAEIQFTRGGEIAALWPIHALRVRVDRESNGEIVYIVQTDYNGERRLPADRVFHLRGFGEDIVGKSVIEYAADAIGWAQALATFGASFFNNNLTLGGVIIQKGEDLSPEAKDILLEEFEGRHKGAENAFRPVVLDAGMDWKTTTATPEQGQYVDAMKMADLVVARFFAVPPSEIGIMEGATYDNFEHQSIKSVSRCLMPWITALEQEADYKLARDPETYTRMMTDELLRGDAVSMSTMLTTYTDKGLMTLNEGRARLNLNPLPGGDVPRVQQQYQPLGGGDDAAAP